MLGQVLGKSGIAEGEGVHLLQELDLSKIEKLHCRSLCRRAFPRAKMGMGGQASDVNGPL